MMSWLYDDVNVWQDDTLDVLDDLTSLEDDGSSSEVSSLNSFEVWEWDAPQDDAQTPVLKSIEVFDTKKDSEVSKLKALEQYQENVGEKNVVPKVKHQPIIMQRHLPPKSPLSKKLSTAVRTRPCGLLPNKMTVRMLKSSRL